MPILSIPADTFSIREFEDDLYINRMAEWLARCRTIREGRKAIYMYKY